MTDYITPLKGLGVTVAVFVVGLALCQTFDWLVASLKKWLRS